MPNSIKFWSFQVLKIQIESNLAQISPLILIQISFQNLKSSNKENCSLFNSLQANILLRYCWAWEGNFLSESNPFSSATRASAATSALLCQQRRRGRAAATADSMPEEPRAAGPMRWRNLARAAGPARLLGPVAAGCRPKSATGRFGFSFDFWILLTIRN
jgi:hypothetical protein